MLDNEGYEYFYSYGCTFYSFLPLTEALEVHIQKYDYEEYEGEVFVYDPDEYVIHYNNLDEIIFHLHSDNKVFAECIKMYEDLDSEEDIDFISDAEEFYKYAVYELKDHYKRQLRILEDSLKNYTSNEDISFVKNNMNYVNGIINNINSFEKFKPRITTDI